MMPLTVYLLVMVFVLGTIMGSLLNVCIYRIPLEKSILWPASRCGHCFQPVRWYDNLPLLSYWVLRGRCRACGARFSIRYFLVELLTGLCFAVLFYLEVLANVHHIDALNAVPVRLARFLFPWWDAWAVFGFHAVLLSFLLVATFCDLDRREIPFSLTVTGTVLGLIGSVLFPWPWPTDPARAAMPAGRAWWLVNPELGPQAGLYPWPVWGPLPDWLPAGSWQLGLATGVAGLLVGTLMMRAVRFLFTKGLGVEALGLGDADLMMMAGSFLGWQPLVLGFFLSVVPGLLFALVQLLLRWRVAWSQRTIKATVLAKDGTPVFRLDGQTVARDDLGPALARLVQDQHKRDLLLDSMELDEAVDQAVAAVRSAAEQAGIRRVRVPAHEEPPGLVGRLLSSLLGFFRREDGSSLEVKLFPRNGQPGVAVNGQEVPLEQLAMRLQDLAKGRHTTEVRINADRLEKWADGSIGALRSSAAAAGVRKVHARDNAIPFGPSLALGVMLSLLGWQWLKLRFPLQALLFNGPMLALLTVSCGVLMLAASYGIRVSRLMRR